MAGFACPYCGHALTAGSDNEPLDRCPSCDGSLLIAYRYRLVAARGEISGGVLYEAIDDGFDVEVAVLFAAKPNDAAEVDRFLEGNRLFAELGGRGLARVLEVGSRGDRRPYVVMDWISGGTLESRVTRRGAIDQVTLIDVIKDLLAGLGRAHRSMPAIVHGHIHPGKIGFIDDAAVLFGFEWARQVFEQDSHLADTFIAGDAAPRQSDRARDLRMLACALVYAGTGEWAADRTLAEQRDLARSRLPGPIGTLLDRMLAAGSNGYKSAVDAAIDLENLLRGSSSFRPRKLKQRDYSRDLAASAWSASDAASSAAFDDYVVDRVELIDDVEAVEAVEDDDGDDDGDDGDDDDYEDYDEDDIEELFDEPASPPPPHRAASTFDAALYQKLQDYQQQAGEAGEAGETPNVGKLIGVTLGATIMFATCVVGLVSEDESDYRPPQPIVYEPPAMPEPIELPSYEPVPGPTLIDGIHRYTGTITGPEDVAGIDLGQRCDVWVEPNGEGSLNCRWYIDCGEPRRRVYGGGNIGYSTCTVEDGHPTSASDSEDDAPDGAFMAVLDGTEPMVIVTDRWLLPPTRVLISIDEGGGFYPGPIPDVPLAPRMEREAIEAALARGESPEFNAGPPAQLRDEQLLAVLDTSLGELHGCEVEADATLRVAIDIRPNGRVAKVKIDPEQAPAIERCVTRSVRKLRFPEFTGEAMSINWNVSW